MTMLAGEDSDEVVHLIYANDLTPYLLSLFEKSANMFTLCNIPILIQLFNKPKPPTCMRCMARAEEAMYEWHEMVRDAG